MPSPVKLSVHTTAVASEKDQLMVWINRMSIAMHQECPPDKVSLNIYVSADVELDNVPPTHCELNVTVLGNKENPATKDELKMAALAHAISPWAEAAAIMSLNVLPVQSIRPILYHLMDSGIPHIASTIGEVDLETETLKAGAEEEFFRQKVLSDKYYTDDLIMFTIDAASRQLAKVKAFNLSKRLQLIKKAAGDPVVDFQNRVFPTLESWKNDELYRVNPHIELSSDLEAIHADRDLAHKTPYMIAFDANHLPWDSAIPTDMGIAVRQPYMRYAMAVYNTAEYVSAQFLYDVFRKANSFTQYDPPAEVRNLPGEVRAALDSKCTAQELYDLVIALKGKNNVKG